MMLLGRLEMRWKKMLQVGSVSAGLREIRAKIPDHMSKKTWHQTSSVRTTISLSISIFTCANPPGSRPTKDSESDISPPDHFLASCPDCSGATKTFLDVPGLLCRVFCLLVETCPSFHQGDGKSLVCNFHRRYIVLSSWSLHTKRMAELRWSYFSSGANRNGKSRARYDDPLQGHTCASTGRALAAEATHQPSSFTL
jgi:hypothetical protein